MDSLMIVHSIGVLHRDISPDNIYIANDGTVKLLDFGAARQVLGEQSKSLSVVLKPGFAPIEQYQTRGKQGPWTDVYSLAATMYYCLTGQIPDASMDRIDEDNLQSLTQQGVTVTPILEKALSKALSLRAVNRFQTIVEFKNALISNFEESIIPIDKRNHMSSVIFSPKNTTKAFNGKDALNISEVDSSVDKIQKIPLNKRNRIKLISSIAVVFLLFGIGVVALSAYVNNNRATKNTKNQITTNSQIYELNADSIASIEYSKLNSNSIFQSSQINSLNSQYISKDITSNILHEYKYEIALITDVGTIDDKSYNQSSWEGVEKFAKEKKITYKYYAPTDKTTDAYLATIKLAVDGGAKIVVTPGFLFEPAIFIAQDKYPNVKFILLDGYPQDGSYKEFRIEKNVLSIFYAEEQAGFLAGYAAVKDGMKKLGFMGGMAVPVVIRFGYGFVQGADYAANEMKLAKNSIEIKYNYLGGFGPSPDYMTKAASWYNSGTEVIFAAAGGAGASVMAAAEEKSKKVIGVDIDQSTESKTVITSAMKMLGQSTYMALSDYYSTNFKGGQSITLDAKQNGIGLPTDFSKFTTFKKADYDAIYAKLVADTDKIASNIKIDKYGDTVVNLFDIVTKVVIIRDIN
jgi:basic membrane protein A